jgi:serine/threonine-protein kinase HipA
MTKAQILVHNIKAGILEQLKGGKYKFSYHADYQGEPVSLTMPLSNRIYKFNKFPPFFEGLLPEGIMLEGLLRKCKIDSNDYLRQLITVGQDVVGAVTIEEIVR